MQLVEGNIKLRRTVEIIWGGGVEFHSEAWFSFVSKKWDVMSWYVQKYIRDV